MSSVFSKPKPPPPPPKPIAPPPAPETADVRVKAAGEAESKRARLAKGRQSTILTGPLGTTDQATVQRKTLLGQ